MRDHPTALVCLIDLITVLKGRSRLRSCINRRLRFCGNPLAPSTRLVPADAAACGPNETGAKSKNTLWSKVATRTVGPPDWFYLGAVSSYTYLPAHAIAFLLMICPVQPVTALLLCYCIYILLLCHSLNLTLFRRPLDLTVIGLKQTQHQ